MTSSQVLVGDFVGLLVGFLVGQFVGLLVGFLVGDDVGLRVGDLVGSGEDSGEVVVSVGYFVGASHVLGSMRWSFSSKKSSISTLSTTTSPHGSVTR